MRILLISHAFNMDGRAASQTITDKLPHFIRLGIRPVVLSAVTGVQDSVCEHYRLLPWGPRALKFDLRHVLKRNVTSALHFFLCKAILQLVLGPFAVIERLLVPLENNWSWSLPAFMRGCAVLNRRDIDLIYTTGGATSAHLAGLWLKMRFGVPWIAEIHDPLYYEGWNKGFVLGRFSLWLERAICTHSSYVFWFTNAALHSAKARNKHIDFNAGVIIPGADNPFVRPVYPKRANRMDFSYFGSLSSTRSMNDFLEALNLALEEYPAFRKKVCIRVFGGSLDHDSMVTVQRYKLQDLVYDCGRLEYDSLSDMTGRERILLEMRASNCLLLLHGEGPVCSEYIPSKTYEYLWMGRPILALVHNNDQLRSMMNASGNTAVAASDRYAIKSAIVKLMYDWTDGLLEDRASTSIYTAERAAYQIYSVANGLCSSDRKI